MLYSILYNCYCTSNQLDIKKNDLKNEFKVIGTTCEHYRLKIKSNY